MGLSSPGIGSNLDINGIVSQLMSIEQKPLTALAKKEASYQAKLSGFGTLKGALSQFQSAVQGLSNISKFQLVQATPADASIASASATGSATPGTYSLEVSKLAQAQKVVALGTASETGSIGSDAATTTLSFDFGTVTGGSFDTTSGHYTGASFASNGAGVKTVTIEPGDNSLAAIRDAINKAGIGVTATIVNDGGTSPYRLALTVNATGKTNSMKISVDGDAAVSALLSHDPANNSGQALAQTVAAQNAEFKVDGIAVSKTTNSASDVVQGLTLNLLKVGGPTNITVARDTNSIVNSVNAFVKAYNDINQNLTDAGAYNATTKQAAILNGEGAVRSIQAQLRGILTSPIAGGASAFTLLSQVGVSVQKNGSLAVDSAKLQTAIEKNFSDIAGLFAATGKTTDSLVTYSGAAAATTPGSYAITVSKMATQAVLTGNSTMGNPGHGSIKGSASAGLDIVTGSNDTLVMSLDGVSNVTVTIPPATYNTAAELADAVELAINSAPEFAGKAVTVTESNGVLKITSDLGGTSSSVDITGGDGKANLLGATPIITAGSETSITAGVNDSIGVTLDGVTKTVKLAEGNYSFDALAAELQSKINGTSEFSSAQSSVTVTQSAGVLTLTSKRYGSASNITLTGASGLIGTSPTATGEDVAGTINGVAATGSGQMLIAAGGDASRGLSVKIAGGTTGARGTINYSQGYAYQFEKLTTALLAADGPLSSRTDGINESLKSLAKTKQNLAQRLTETEKRYRAQFTALDTAISSMTKTSSFLAQQLANLPKIED